MSRHHIQLSQCGRAIVVVAGCDRPLRQLFLPVLRDEESRPTYKDDTLYDSLHDPAIDWTSASTRATWWFGITPTSRRNYY
ncbi:MAG: hypothetical protein BGO63_06820 [Candidatus Accumulibacter sp. 66-26]|nr:MAG: hypothetical protein BGO63_06820 [Candidatus Accumulibacter sp. 66-26]